MRIPPAPVLVLLLFLALPLPRLNALSAVGGEDLTVSLMTVGPGKPLYVWWGHIGLIVESEKKGWSYFYDFGNFSFEEDHFYRNFAMGRLYYLAMKAHAPSYQRYLSLFDRSVTVYDLNLSPDEKIRLLDYLEEGVKPENRTYLYHHYEDNCSTRVRDALDYVMEGELRRGAEGYALSYRDQANRFIRPFWAYFLLNYLQGTPVDKPISLWDALYLPTELEKWTEQFVRSDGTPLVSEIHILQEGPEIYLPPAPFPRTAQAFLWGMALFFLSMVLRFHRGRLRGFWNVFSVLITALPGIFLSFMMFFTDHLVTRGNLNALITCPVLLAALLPLGKNHYRRMWDIQALLVFISLMLRFLPGMAQDNGFVLLVYLPLILAQGSAGAYMAGKISFTERRFPWSPKS
ncbi:MAG: DUF4105 domain-containing protein [Spirochaetales bacterium]|nr:DUF4105 domain-containing protein [Spirochaetales bacterium]